jgi:hypothetical protein
LIQNEGAVWNFPAGKSGIFTTRVMLPNGSKGARINLTDRWFNPTDTTAYQFSMFSIKLHPGMKSENSLTLEEDTWYTLRFLWNGLNERNSDQCKLYIDDSTEPISIPLNRESLHGISYVHFISTAEKEDLGGLLVESVEANIE